MRVIWLGPAKGALTDWVTQQWVKLTGPRGEMESFPWLSGPIGKTTGIGADYFNTLAAEQGYVVNASEGVRGLIKFKDLSGPGFDPEEDPGFYFTVHGPRVWARYVRTMRESIRVYPADEPGDVRPSFMKSSSKRGSLRARSEKEPKVFVSGIANGHAKVHATR